MATHPSNNLSYGGGSLCKIGWTGELDCQVIVVAVAPSIFLGALGIFVIRVAIAYAIIKKANHKD